MDISRKFLQMGRTRSLRYALRPGGRKYGPVPTETPGPSKHRRDGTAVGEEMKRTGKVYDQGKLDGAGIFEGYEKRCWADEVYTRMWDEWKASQRKAGKGEAADRNSKGGANLNQEMGHGDGETGKGEGKRQHTRQNLTKTERDEADPREEGKVEKSMERTKRRRT